MKSFGLLRTNVGLTTNIKVTIDTNYKFSLDSIESDPNLSFDKFKKVSFTKDNYYDELIPYFYKDLPADTAFSIKYDNDVDTMSNDFRNQYDELYSYGARNIVNNKNYSEEYEYFAPLYITKNHLPKKFIIFRVDGSGIGTTDRSNFNAEIIKKLKTVKLFDLSKQSVLGDWLGKNFTDNKYFPDSPLDIDFRNLEFCRWNGIDYQNGGYTYKSLFIDDILDEEKEIFELEKFIFDSYKNNKVVFPNIINFSFLFDDTPSTPEIKKKWSINRYYGFYLNDLELVKTVSPYLSIPLRSDIIIQNNAVIGGDTNSVSNIIYSPSNENPFLQEWSNKRPFYVEYDGNYYKVEKFTETVSNQLVKIPNTFTTMESRMSKDLGFSSSKFNKNASVIKKSVTTNTKSAVEDFGDVIVTKYKIITNLNLTGLTASSFNQNYAEIDPTNKLITRDGSTIKDFQIAGFDSADVWIIEIDGIYHNLVNIDNYIMLSTDYSFIFNQNDFIYKVRGESKKVSTVVDFNNAPKKFSIYKLNFCDIKDFDTRIVDTDYSKYEYEESTNITTTDETKMYLEDIRSLTDPINLDDFSYQNRIVNIPTSSEYTANYETFKIDGNDLSEIWRKNPVYCKWGFHKSLSANDLPYTLNNSLIFEDFNRTTNVYEPYPKRSERNLDYFYTINSASSSYVYHSLHIENLDNNNNIDTEFKFELNKYLNFTYSYFDSITSTTQSTSPYPYDYFTYLFGKSNTFFNGKIKENSNKYSYFNVGDESVPNHTLFRGIKFDIYEVSSITINTNNQIDKINIKSSNTFDDYKFSVLLSENNTSPIFDTLDSSKITGLVYSPNTLMWSVIDEWKMNKRYVGGTSWAGASKVLHDDILYGKYGNSSTTNNPIFATYGVTIPSAPYTQGWTFFVSNNDSVFWSPNYNGYTSLVGPTAAATGEVLPFGYKLQEPNKPSIVYNSGEYYFCSSQSNAIDFWNPLKSISTGYMSQDTVIYKNNYYTSLKDNNYFKPTMNTWTASTGVTSAKWKIIESWNATKQYYWNDNVVYNESVYKLYTSNSDNISLSDGIPPVGTEPVKSKGFWFRNNGKSFNSISVTSSIVKFNNKYNILVGGGKTTTSSLNNGIIIYINKKWKNILVNINISDGTTPDISNSNRDSLYNDINQKLTAANFINAINDISNKYGFSNYLSYVVVDENNNIKKYSYSDVDGGNIKDLPYLLRCEEPDKLDIKVNSLFKRAVELPNTLNPIRKLDSGRIVDITQLNYFNNIPVAANIIENQFPPKVFENYHGNTNIIKNEIYRYSGYYSPVFYDVQLFERDSNGIPSGGNYKFDTLLNDFGIMKERKIRKVNRKGNILRLGNVNDEKSIYPMLDEFGYSIYDFFIFSSTWDLKYYLETVSVSKNKDYLQRYTIDENVINAVDIVTPIVIPSNIGKTQDN